MYYAERPDHVFIYRPPGAEDLALIESIQGTLEDVPSFRPVELPHLTLLRGAATMGLALNAMRAIVHPLPETADQPYTLDVESIRIHEKDIHWASIAIHLDAAGTAYETERDVFRNRILAMRRKHVTQHDAHVTLGYLSPEYATSGVRHKWQPRHCEAP